jgi:hypothetical protein
MYSLCFSSYAEILRLVIKPAETAGHYNPTHVDADTPWPDCMTVACKFLQFPPVAYLDVTAARLDRADPPVFS